MRGGSLFKDTFWNSLGGGDSPTLTRAQQPWWTLSECSCSGMDPTLSQQLALCLGPLVLEEAVWGLGELKDHSGGRGSQELSLIPLPIPSLQLPCGSRAACSAGQRVLERNRTPLSALSPAALRLGESFRVALGLSLSVSVQGAACWHTWGGHTPPWPCKIIILFLDLLALESIYWLPIMIVENFLPQLPPSIFLVELQFSIKLMLNITLEI